MEIDMAGTFRELVIKDPRLPGREKDRDGNLLPKRSPKWPAKRKAWLKAHPKCEACGKEASKIMAPWTMQVHHSEPFHLFPEKELDERTYVTMCSNPRCHLGDGHLNNFKKWNPYVKELCALRKMIQAVAPKTREYDKKTFVELAKYVATWVEKSQGSQP